MTYFAALSWSKQQIKKFRRKPSLLAYVKYMYFTLDTKNTILQTLSSIISIAHYLVK